MALQQQEIIERQCADLVRLREQLAKALQSNAKLSADGSLLREKLCEANLEIERLETRALRVALSSAPPPPVDDGEDLDDDDYDGPDAPDYDAPTSRESYERSYAESMAVSTRGR